ncbi:MAG: bifunctional [glutamine synthetase] adenylyltransferase/[glutamine synthetase]-adenylyl-L-tyrosine phosphorylase [Actinomycetaceae bacterium]|nr:bifunctional [glutamine synthetase] adenylyltransferase/[glutamine synthetase]-adenylyl-L-tyrosine phosphorylase [Actinomycetaceae bacterium]
MTREVSLKTLLVKAGLQDLSTGQAELHALSQLWVWLQDSNAQALFLEQLSFVADPDMALRSLLYLAQSASSSDGVEPLDIPNLLQRDPETFSRLLFLLGASQFYGEYVLTHPEIVASLAEPIGEAEDLQRAMLEAVEASFVQGRQDVPGVWVAGPGAGVEDLRRAYWSNLSRIASLDLSLPSPCEGFTTIGALLSDLVDATLEAALALARRDIDPSAQVRLSIIAMGKTGARELNYISDVDVIAVVAPGLRLDDREELPATSEATALHMGTLLMKNVAQLCTVSCSEPSLWVLDMALRPEGKDGALVRTLESHKEYYAKWAKSWEFQALLKARPCAGDAELGYEYWQAMNPLVWQASEKEGFVEDARAMRARVEETIPRAHLDRELKLGPGGLRDVEFTVQLLQLVHGRLDETLRASSTLDALEALSKGGYVGRDHARELAHCYCALRSLEHRIQLFRMRRTHLVPKDEGELRRLGRSISREELGDGSSLEAWWMHVRAKVRHLHEEIFFRPLLPLTARLSREDASLSPDVAAQRLAAIGYRDPNGAVQHIAALTEGVTRRAAIQRQLLPVMIGWFAQGANPDAGLLEFRRVSETIGDTHWYLRLLRDSGAAAQRLARVLSFSPYIAQAFPDMPEAVRWLDDDADLQPRTRDELDAEMVLTLARHLDAKAAASKVGAIRRRELLRCAVLDVLDGIRPVRAASMITPAGAVALAGALHVSLRDLQIEPSNGSLLFRGRFAEHLIVAMGRLGGAEAGYASDADVIFVYRAIGDDDEAAAEEATQVATGVRALLGTPGPMYWEVDTSLRPEGKKGALTRSLASYQEYYQRWASPWERQALLRATPIAGSLDLAKAFVDLINPVRYETELKPKELVEIRKLKARIETERLPRGMDPHSHVKLGPGGLADVEWTVQLLQLQHAQDLPALRTPSTLGALRAASSHGLIEASQAVCLEDAWTLASQIRAATVLGVGRVSGPKLDQLPMGQSMVVVAQLLGYKRGFENDLADDYLRTARRARKAVDEIFWN